MDRELFQHKQWLGLLQPTGLVVSPPALTKAGIFVNRDVIVLQQDLQALAAPTETDGPPAITDFVEFATDILNWQPENLVPQNELPPELTLPLPEYGETLKPTYGVPHPDGDRWLMLVQVLAVGEELDAVGSEVENSRRWQASPQARLERLLRETQIPVGLLCNGTHLRLVYAPRGESSGFVTFPVEAMCEVSGRLILGAMEMLLCEARVFEASEGESLAELLRDSRQYQNEVSVKLAEQVLGALWELLRGFQAADLMVGGKVLGDLAAENPQHIYGGLITTLLRLVFLLYAEDEGLMPGDRVYSGNYSVTRLFDKLQQDAGNYPDTMDQRYGAWAWLVSLFRLVYEGGGHVPEYLPARHGELFDPESYPFLEGNNKNIPRVADGVIYRVLRGLLIVDGERLSYRSLDVEHIGSVYEAVMGYEVKRAAGASIGVWSKPAGAKVSVTVVVDIDRLLKTKANDRNKLLDTEAGCKLSGNALKELKAAKTADDIVAALGRRVSPQTPVLLPVGSLYLQPTEERRRSGSHYTPRAMTEPIVRDALAPVLARLGESPTAEQILSLKICDLAMGSGAFLVESCRQLAEVLVKVWDPPQPPLKRGGQEMTAVFEEGGSDSSSPLAKGGRGGSSDEPLLLARRIIAQRCLYGVDKNSFAVSLAKLSLWLVTLSKNQPFTFLDSALKCGDSLVGLTGDEIKSFTWYPQKKDEDLGPLFVGSVDDSLETVREKREGILKRKDEDYDGKKLLNDAAENALEIPRTFSKLIIASFFSEGKKKARQERLEELRNAASLWRKDGDMSSRMEEALEFANDNEVKPFNWHLEFPEVFDGKNPGFDVIVGNPPFAGKNTTINANVAGYLDWLKELHPESHGNSDLVAHFFRRTFNLIRKNGTLGLIATNTISQGDTRNSGLRFICNNGGTIYRAIKRKKWEGAAAVVVSVVHIFKGVYEGVKLLDEKEVELISAFLFHSGGNDDPKTLLANGDKSFIGSYVLGMGFTFDDTTDKATPIAEMERLIKENPKNQECIFPYIGGSEVNSSPTHAHHRYIINFWEMSEAEAREYPDLMKIVEEKVKPERLALPPKNSWNRTVAAKWWLFGADRVELKKAIAPLSRVLVCSLVSKHLSLVFLPPNMVFSHKTAVFATDKFSQFSIIQSRTHEVWARFFSSTLEDRLNYSPTDCFQTFPFPANWETDTNLEEIGKTYYEYRAQLMVKNNQGLTETYNRFHDPGESHPDIKQLRQLHTEMDAAILKAYGWQDIPTNCDFYLDYEEETDEEEGSNRRRRKKPYRYRWPDAVAEDVLARLLELNEERYQEEELAGKAAEAKVSKSRSGGKKKSKKKVEKDEPTISGFKEASGG